MKIRLRRGTEANRTLFTPDVGEPIFTTDTKKLYIGDGQTPGGIAVDLNLIPTLSKTDVGLSNVDNTSDANKPVSTAQAAAIAAVAAMVTTPKSYIDLKSPDNTTWRLTIDNNGNLIRTAQ